MTNCYPNCILWIINVLSSFGQFFFYKKQFFRFVFLCSQFVSKAIHHHVPVAFYSFFCSVTTCVSEFDKFVFSFRIDDVAFTA